MKIGTVFGALAALALSAPAAANDTELNYPKGSLGYANLVAGNYEGAIRSIQADTNVRHDDPAQMLNLALAYERSGQYAEARRYYRGVLSQGRSERLVLSNGTVVESHALAEQGLRRVDATMARR